MIAVKMGKTLPVLVLALTNRPTPPPKLIIKMSLEKYLRLSRQGLLDMPPVASEVMA